MISYLYFTYVLFPFDIVVIEPCTRSISQFIDDMWTTSWFAKEPIGMYIHDTIKL